MTKINLPEFKMKINVKSEQDVEIKIGGWTINIDNSTNEQIVTKYRMPNYTDWHNCEWIESND